MTEQQALQAIRAKKGRFFAVEFRRKTKGRNGELPGTIRKMTCRRSVRRYCTSGRSNAGSDAENSVLTVWDVEAFRAARREGKPLGEAGRQAYRRINLAGIVRID